MSAIAAGEKPFDIRVIDELEAAAAAIQLYNLNTPELVCDVIVLLAGIHQFREQLANAITTYYHMDTIHFSELSETLESVQVVIIKTSRDIAAHVSRIWPSAARPAITPTGRIVMLGSDPCTGRVVWTAFLLALVALIIYKVVSMLLVIVSAVFFSYLLYPLIEQLERRMPRQTPHSVPIGIALILVMLMVIVAGPVFGVAVQEEAGRLVDQLPKLLDISTMADHLALPNFLESLRARILEFLREQPSTTSDQAMFLVRNIGPGAMYATSNLVYLVLIPIMSFLMANETPPIHAALLSWIRFSDKRLWGNIIDNLDMLLSRYVRVLLLLSLATLLPYSIAFCLLGVPYALSLVTTAAVLEFIPFAGPLTAVVTIVTVTMFSGYPHLFQLIGSIVVHHLFQDYVPNSYLMSEGVKVSPLLVIMGLLAGEQLGGVVGIFLSVPVIVVLKIALPRAWAAQSLGREAC